MPLKLRERDIEAKVVRYAKSRQCLIYKFSSPSHRGVCDRIIVTPKGKVGFLELKAPGQKPTPLQHKFIKDIFITGANVHWCDSVKSATDWIDALIWDPEDYLR